MLHRVVLATGLLLLLAMGGLRAQPAVPTPLPVDPSIAAALDAARSGEAVVTLTGYIGPTTAGIVRIYATRALGSWFDVPEATILAVEPPERPGAGPSVLHLRASAQIILSRQDIASVLAGTGRARPMLPQSRAIVRGGFGDGCQALQDSCALDMLACLWAPAACGAGYACPVVVTAGC